MESSACSRDRFQRSLDWCDRPEVSMATVKDPVCGMIIEIESAAARAEVAGQVVYFCSAECATTFKANPARYAQPTAAGETGHEQLEQHEPPYTTTLGFL